MADLLFDWFGISCMTTDNFCFYLQNRLIRTGQTGGQLYIDTSPFSVPCYYYHYEMFCCTGRRLEVNVLTTEAESEQRQ